MKTRIISGIVMAIIVAAFLGLGLYVSPYFITAFIAIIAAIGCYELLKNAAKIESRLSVTVACVYTVLMIALRDNTLSLLIEEPLMKGIYFEGSKFAYWIANIWQLLPTLITVLYFLFAVISLLKNHKAFDLSKIVIFTAMPLFLSYAFSCLGAIINSNNGLFYLLLLLNFSSICDMGAYFVGVTCGKHKLCPEISPKKTVEGAVGGLAVSLIFSIVIVLLFKMNDKFVSTLIFTVPLSIVGILGDLFASIIKRNADIKDYGALIPGHGGILDRFDSILLIAPVLYLLISLGVL